MQEAGDCTNSTLAASLSLCDLAVTVRLGVINKGSLASLPLVSPATALCTAVRPITSLRLSPLFPCVDIQSYFSPGVHLDIYCPVSPKYQYNRDLDIYGTHFSWPPGVKRVSSNYSLAFYLSVFLFVNIKSSLLPVHRHIQPYFCPGVGIGSCFTEYLDVYGRNLFLLASSGLSKNNPLPIFFSIFSGVFMKV